MLISLCSIWAEHHTPESRVRCVSHVANWGKARTDLIAVLRPNLLPNVASTAEAHPNCPRKRRKKAC